MERIPSIHWQTTVPVSISLDAPPIEILGVLFKYSQDDMTGAGLLPKRGEFEQERRKKIKKSGGTLNAVRDLGE